MPHPKKLRTAFDEFTVRRVIGEGGSGFVLEVTSSDGKAYAAKYLRQGSVNSDRLRRFRNELDFCRRTRHEQIISVIDHGIVESDGSPFYVMPLYAMTLRKFFADAAITYQKRFDVLIRLLSGIEAVHLHGVAHRDLKPENVLLSADASQVVLADFGIACFLEAEMVTAIETRDEARLANFKYAAPEQLERGAAGDKRSDIFAVGLIVNEAFTSLLARGSDYRRIKDVAPDFAYLDEVVELMIRQDRDRRIRTIGEVKDEISGRARVHVGRQQLDSLSREVVNETEICDRLINRPPSVEVKDWANDCLYFKLSEPVNHEWQELFSNSGWDGMYPDTTPKSAMWNSSTEFALQHVSAHFAADVRDHYLQHISRTNRKYAEHVAQEQRRQLLARQRELEDNKRRADERLRVLESLRKPR